MNLNKHTKKLIFTIILSIMIMGTAFAEEAALVPGNTLRVTFVPSFGFQIQTWDWEGVSTDEVMFASLGLGLEFGPADWVNFQLLWIPGINVYSKISDGDYGNMTDLFLGVKIGLWAQEGALFESDKIRFSFAPGMKMPLGGFNATEKAETVREPDQHLWGSVLRLYLDYIINPLFFVNVYLEGIYYPKQWTYNPAYKTHLVEHPIDINSELEVHFRYPLKNSAIALKGGLSAAFFIAPVMNSRDDDATNQYCFSTGMYFATEFSPSFDLALRYRFPITGINTEPVHLVSIVARYLFSGSK
ncbi:MAG: hypothetical protein FWF38_07270 [Spirochaetaceae bacterium]|nr:hypothetical protein [Spirochaetaceae bacterium]